MITLRCVQKTVDESGTKTVFNAISDDENVVVFGSVTVVEATPQVATNYKIGARYNEKFKKVAEVNTVIKK